MGNAAVYAGSFDPPTLGHFHMIFEGLKLFDFMYIAIGVNPSKKSMFTTGERVDMIQDWVNAMGFSFLVEVITYEGEFTVDVAESVEAKFLLRGIRNAKDFEYEMEIKDFNDKLNPGIQTVFLTPVNKEVAGISSSLVRGCLGIRNWENAIKDYVTPYVNQKLQAKFLSLNS